PNSSAVSIAASDSSSFIGPKWPACTIVPRPMTLALRPVFPSVRYSISPPNQLFLFLEFGDNCNPPRARHMGYVDHRLQPGERIIYRTKTHPVIFLWPVSLTVISLAGFLAGRENLGEISGGFAALLAVGDILVWQLSDLAVTNRRVIGKFFVRS